MASSPVAAAVFSQTSYAGLGRRVAAHLIDILIAFPVMIMARSILSLSSQIYINQGFTLINLAADLRRGFRGEMKLVANLTGF